MASSFHADTDGSPHGIAKPGISHRSSAIEKVLEYQFLAMLTRELVHRDAEFEVLRGDVDDSGHDIVIEADGMLRHIQLKAMVKGGKRANVTINTKLSRKASGCVIWMVYDPVTLNLGPFRWFGGLPSEPLPPLGERIARHSKGNAEGVKTERPGHRVVPMGHFETLATIGELVNRLFGTVTEARQ